MRKLFLSVLIFFSTLSTFSQTTFKEAYYVNLENDTIRGLIKDIDWKYNPDHFIFKKDENSEEITIEKEDVLLFEILNTSKYISRKVQIDVSDAKLTKLSEKKQAIFETKHLFLKTLVEGEANLYSFWHPEYFRYFF